MNKLLMLSSMGTSLLTNGADEETRKELNRLANLREEELTHEERAFVIARNDEVLNTLAGQNRQVWQKSSAEINGIISYLNDRQYLPSQQDMHILLTSDTFQGTLTASAVEKYLVDEKLGQVQVLQPHSLSTKSKEVFTRAMVEIVKWCEENLYGYRDIGYHVVFNLTGGFKSVQGYLNTLGMLYADELVYLFEPPTQALLTIPRLPLRLDAEAVIRQHAVMLGMLDAAGMLPVALLPDIDDIPELFVERVMEQGEECAALSPWGTAIWKSERKEAYKELRSWPGLEFSDEFKRDVAGTTDINNLVKLQDALALTAALYLRFNGDVSKLMSDGGVQYERLKHAPPFDSLRVSLGLRVGCERTASGILLHKFGMEPVVYSYLERMSNKR